MQRLNFYKTAPEATKALATSTTYNKSSSIDAGLRYLVEMRVSQINGCAYCLDMHASEAREHGEKQQRLDCLSAWHETKGIYTEREEAALAWAESVTNVSQTHVPDDAYASTIAVFSEEELADLTMIIVTMNAWNRIAISFRTQPPLRG